MAAIGGVVEERCSPPIEALSYESSHRFDLREIHNFDESVLWRRSNDSVLTLNGILLASRPFNLDDEDPSEQRHIAYFTLAGYCTARALDAAVREVREVLPTLLRSFQLLAECQRNEDETRCFEKLSQLEELQDQGKLTQFPERPPDDADFEDPWGGPSSFKKIRALLDAYFSASAKNDTIARRIRNSVHLLVQADQQDKHAVGLALSTASMEALLCVNCNGIADMLAKNVAILFEPDLKERLNAMKFVTDLYGKRSSVLHGSEIDCKPSDRDHARLLAAAIMQALIDRRDFVRRQAGHKDETPAELFAKLRNHLFAEEPFLGVESSPVNSLWRRGR